MQVGEMELLHRVVHAVLAGGEGGSLSTEAKRMQNSSGLWTSSAKSTADQTQAFSLPVCSCSFVPGITAAHSTEITGGEAAIGLHTRGAALGTPLACSVSAR